MSSIPSGSLRQNRSMSPWSQLTHPLLRLCYHVSTVHVHGEVAKYRQSKPVCNENVNSLPQSPMRRVPCAVVKLERDCAVMCVLNDLLDVILASEVHLTRQNDRGHAKTPEVYFDALRQSRLGWRDLMASPKIPREKNESDSNSTIQQRQ